MRRILAFAAFLAGIASVAPLYGDRIDPKRQYPRFQIGVTGIHATIEPGLVVTVAEAQAGTPAEGRLESGDVLLTAGGRSLDLPDPRVPLGAALGEAEATDGRLVLRIRRGAVEREVVVVVPVLGPYGKTWPLDCAKSRAIIRQTAEFLVAAQQPDGSYKLGGETDREGLNACLQSLFLLSTGQPEYLPNVERNALAVAQSAEREPSDSAWHLGYQGILLAEYHLRTGDRRVLPGLTRICRQAAEGQRAGAWGHYVSELNPGYVQSGLMNSAGVTLFAALCLARECGVTESEEAFLKSLRFFYRMVGHGSICYGDHRAEIYPDTNGRNAVIACAMSVLDGRAYEMAGQHLAMLVADSYYAPEAGHTGGGFNVIWRGLGAVHVPPAAAANYRRHMDRLAWYYDLTRMPGGGMSLLPSPPNTTRYCGLMWGTGAIGLTYTAPLRTLRLTGAPRSRFGVEPPALPRYPWGELADGFFLRADFCEGYGVDDVAPHEAYGQVHPADAKPPVSLCAKLMRHSNPMLRTWAARKLAAMRDDASAAALAEALAHRDPRVRRAAMDGVSGYDNWRRPSFGPLSREVVSATFLPGIERALNDPRAAWWEIDGALWALGHAQPEDIRRLMPRVRKYAEHEEWYLNEAAFWAVVGLRKDIRGPELEMLADVYVHSRHVFARSSYDMGFQFLLHRERIEIDRATSERLVRKLGETAHSALIADRYGNAGRHEATHRTMMVFSRLNDPSLYALVLDDLVEYLGQWDPNYQHSQWLIVGSPWQPGLVKVAEQLGPDAGPLIDAFRRCLAETEWNVKDSNHVACRDALTAAVADYDRKHRNR